LLKAGIALPPDAPATRAPVLSIRLNEIGACRAHGLTLLSDNHKNFKTKNVRYLLKEQRWVRLVFEAAEWSEKLAARYDAPMRFLACETLFA
jgi:hypothetical protein